MRVHEHQMAPITSDCDAMRVHEHLMAVITSDCDRPTRTRAGLGRVMCEAAAEQRERRAFSLSETTPFFHEAAAQRGNAGFLCSLKQGLSSLKLIATTSFERQQHSKERRGCLALEKQRLPSMRQEHTKGSRAVLCSQTLAFVANPSFHEAGAQSREVGLFFALKPLPLLQTLLSMRQEHTKGSRAVLALKLRLSFRGGAQTRLEELKNKKKLQVKDSSMSRKGGVLVL